MITPSYQKCTSLSEIDESKSVLISGESSAGTTLNFITSSAKAKSSALILLACLVALNRSLTTLMILLIPLSMVVILAVNQGGAPLAVSALHETHELLGKSYDQELRATIPSEALHTFSRQSKIHQLQLLFSQLLFLLSQLPFLVSQLLFLFL